jgi:hypothetical protein
MHVRYDIATVSSTPLDLRVSESKSDNWKPRILRYVPTQCMSIAVLKCDRVCERVDELERTSADYCTTEETHRHCGVLLPKDRRHHPHRYLPILSVPPHPDEDSLLGSYPTRPVNFAM